MATNPAPDPRQQLQQIAQDAFAQAPTTYISGFVSGLGATDVYHVCQTNGQTTLVINMSLSLAKTLAQSLAGLIEQFEKQTGQPVLTMQQASAATSAV